MLILPGNPLFDFTLGTIPPPGYEQSTTVAFVARTGSGILEPVGEEGFEEYVEGGEYDERMLEIEENEYADS